jgi:hypothetical protein
MTRIVSRTLRLTHRLLRIAGLENRIKLLAEKYPKVSEEAIRKYAEMDFTNGKYLEWLIRQESNGIVEPGQLDRHKDEVRDIINFHIKVTKNPYFQEATGLPKNLGKTPISEVSRQMKFRQEDLKELELREKSKDKGFRVVYNTPPYKIIEIGGKGIDPSEAVNALCYYGMNKWCTRYHQNARQWLEGGPVWIVFKNGKSLLQTDGGDVRDVQNKTFSWENDKELLRILVDLGILLKHHSEKLNEGIL